MFIIKIAMGGFEPGSTAVICGRSANCATTTAHFVDFYFDENFDIICSIPVFCENNYSTYQKTKSIVVALEAFGCLR